jgi:hypothetical protein
MRGSMRVYEDRSTLDECIGLKSSVEVEASVLPMLRPRHQWWRWKGRGQNCTTITRPSTVTMRKWFASIGERGREIHPRERFKDPDAAGKMNKFTTVPFHDSSMQLISGRLYNSEYREVNSSRWRQTMRKIAVLVVFVSVALHAQVFVPLNQMHVETVNKTDTWSWVSPAFTPCEGVGVTGSAKYFAVAGYEMTSVMGPSGVMSASKYLTSLSIRGESASFDDETVLAARLDRRILPTSGWVFPLNFHRPKTSTIEAPPGPYSTRSLYLSHEDFCPLGGGNCKGLVVYNFTNSHLNYNSELRLTVTAAKEGCHVNTSVNTHVLQ